MTRLEAHARRQQAGLTCQASFARPQLPNNFPSPSCRGETAACHNAAWCCRL